MKLITLITFNKTNIMACSVQRWHYSKDLKQLFALPKTTIRKNWQRFSLPTAKQRYKVTQRNNMLKWISWSMCFDKVRDRVSLTWWIITEPKNTAAFECFECWCIERRKNERRVGKEALKNRGKIIIVITDNFNCIQQVQREWNICELASRAKCVFERNHFQPESNHHVYAGFIGPCVRQFTAKPHREAKQQSNKEREEGINWMKNVLRRTREERILQLHIEMIFAQRHRVPPPLFVDVQLLNYSSHSCK